MATTYLNGTSENVYGHSVFGVSSNLPKGRIDAANGEAIESVVLGVNGPPLGRIDTGANVGSISDRAPNVPSGYNVNGTPEYGDGKLNTVTTWAADKSGSHPDTEFVWNQPLRPVSTKFSDLS